jgi:deoxyxylulose-5-phosphate synthase
VTAYRENPGASVAVIAVGAPSYLAGAAADRALAQGVPVDVFIVNGFPLHDGFLEGLAARYRRVVTIEDGLIGDPQSGTRGFAGMVATALAASGVRLAHLGISDPRTAPSEHFIKVWEHFGITEEGLLGEIL